MEIAFLTTGHRRAPSLVSRADGVRLSVPVFGPLEPIPHDLAHYVVERELALADGFWGSVAAGAIFEGMRVLSGRQPPHARERSRAIMKANHDAILFAELVVDVALRAVKGEPLGPAALPVVQAGTRADRDNLIKRLLPSIQEMCERWQDVPPGGTLRVTWPDLSVRRGRGASREKAAAGWSTVPSV
jgi:hypothetical protein